MTKAVGRFRHLHPRGALTRALGATGVLSVYAICGDLCSDPVRDIDIAITQPSEMHCRGARAGSREDHLCRPKVLTCIMTDQVKRIGVQVSKWPVLKLNQMNQTPDSSHARSFQQSVPVLLK